MGRRGQTGSGGAVVSSLSSNSGGTVKKKAKPGKKTDEKERDPGVDIVFEGASSKRKPKKPDPSSAASATGSKSAAGSSSAASEPVLKSAGWIGKSPMEFLREWCQKNNRKRPSVRALKGPRGEDGTMECFIPPGRRDGPPVKGGGFEAIRGFGDKPGEQYAALNVLHQVERGRNLQQILAPEFREVWLDMDKRFKETQEAQAQAAFHAERKKKAAARKAQAERNAESATISVSTASRQAIEDVLVGQTSGAVARQAVSLEASEGNPFAEETAEHQGSGNVAAEVSDAPVKKMEKELMNLGFSRMDAECASVRFDSLNDALDYLCLTLDEEELPKSFAPTADVEVVQFYSPSSSLGGVRVNVVDAQRLADVMSCSRLAAERALKSSDGNWLTAAESLASTLSSFCLRLSTTTVDTPAIRQSASSEKDAESEALDAIYGGDVLVGVGVVADFPSSWGARILVRNGIPGLSVTDACTLCLVDTQGMYPLQAPIVFVSPESSSISRAHRRLAMRAAASYVNSMYSDVDSNEPVHVAHAVCGFLADSTEEELFEAAARRPLTSSNRPSAKQFKALQQGTSPGLTKQNAGVAKRHSRWRRPRAVPLKQLDNGQLRALESMKMKRSRLPAWQSRDEVLEIIRQNQVTVVSGATGSGKTTQIPQFLLEHAAATREPVSIVCTQPRRIAAISIAQRVAAERCEDVGDSVGYQVKLNVKRSDDTQLVFCTTGVLLRQMQSGDALDGLTHIVVDEVHERSVETDFLLLLLRDVLAKRPSLRVVLMSATIDAAKFASYFGNGGRVTVPVVSIPGRTFPVEQKYLEDAIDLTNYRMRIGDRYAKRVHRHPAPGAATGEGAWKVSRSSATDAAKEAAEGFSDEEDELQDDWESDDGDELATSDASSNRSLEKPDRTGFQVGSTFASSRTGDSDSDGSRGETLRLIDESLVNFDLIDALVRRLDWNIDDERTGAMLIFLPGIAEISQVVERLSRGPGASKLFPIALHSALSPDEQSRVFSRPPKGKRKVVCATNIAETSVTVEDVKIVIDTCRVKEMSFDSLNGTSVLEETFASQAAARQRAGRAGRVSEGLCYRLVKKSTFENRLPPQPEPEIRRIALEHVVLNLLSIIRCDDSQSDPVNVLSRAMDPPTREAVDAAVSSLVTIGALERRDGIDSISGSTTEGAVSLTALGKHLSGLPVDARIGKLLIYGAMFGCLDPILTIAATVSERSPFFSPRDKRKEAEDVRKSKFAWGKSDLLMYVRAFNAWQEVRKSGCGFAVQLAFCDEHFLSRKTLIAIGDVRSQLQRSLQDAGFGDGSSPCLNENKNNTRVISAIICAALYPNIIRVDHPERKYESVAGGTIAKGWNAKELKMRARSGERVFLHPESINFDEGNYGSRWLAYFSKVKTWRVYVRDSTMVSPYAILLFGGEIDVRHAREQLAVDKWVVFKSPARTAVLVRELRRNLDALLQRKFQSPWMDLFEDAQARAVNSAILRLIKLES